MTDASRGFVRYELDKMHIGGGEYVGDMTPAECGERDDHSRAMSTASVERIRLSCSEEGGSCHAMMHSMNLRMVEMERELTELRKKASECEMCRPKNLATQEELLKEWFELCPGGYTGNLYRDSR